MASGGRDRTLRFMRVAGIVQYMQSRLMKKVDPNKEEDAAPPPGKIRRRLSKIRNSFRRKWNVKRASQITLLISTKARPCLEEQSERGFRRLALESYVDQAMFLALDVSRNLGLHMQNVWTLATELVACL
ncbi:putative myosin light chain kinase 3 [Branchiostoma belcheri]|nr:putative myosin light chain kinase 3 [Branchiostoma belcheri]